MRSLAHLNKYYFRYRIRLLLGILFVGLNNYFAVYSIRYVREAVDYVDRSLKVPGFDAHLLLHEMLLYGGMIIGMALLMGLFMFFMRQTIIVMSRFIEYDLKNEVYTHYQNLDLAFYKRNKIGRAHV